MTLTLDFSPLEQEQLAVVAARRGLKPAALAKKMIAEHLPLAFLEDGEPDSEGARAREQARVAAINAARGSLASVDVTTADLRRERQADKAKEEQHSTGDGR